jgi:RNA methyltransferase, TrmH family
LSYTRFKRSEKNYVLLSVQQLMELSKAKLKYFAALEGKKFRAQEGLFLAEGLKMLQEGLKAGFMPHSVVTTPEGLSRITAIADSIPAEKQFITTETEFKRLSAQVHPEGILSVWPVPGADSYWEGDSTGIQRLPETAFLLEDVRDPGNLGTLIRIADWFGMEAIIASHTSADCFNPKVLRSSMGSIFRTRVIYLNDFHSFCQAHAARISGASMDGIAIGQPDAQLRKWILLGNEANGISSALREVIGIKWVRIPGSGNAESLNVAIAGGILAHALMG